MSRPVLSAADLFHARVQKGPGCWTWTGTFNAYGYGRVKVGGKNGRMLMAHRIAYELYVGSIPEGLTLDHLCRNRGCVNPAHLEPATRAVNTLRGTAPAALNARLEVCKKVGHPLTPDNLTYDTPGHRRCKICRAEYEAERNRRQREARAAARLERAA